MKTKLMIIAILIAVSSLMSAQVRIAKLSGEVQVRRGLEEEWRGAGIGLLLKDIDTILTGERGEVVLELGDGASFTLGANSMIDIGDLRKIGEKELFLYLMKQKVNRLEKRDGSQRVRLSQVSVVHGHNSNEDDSAAAAEMQVAEPAKNGIRALYQHGYYPNTIVKLDRLISEGWAFADCGEFRFYLGRSFQAMNRSGQALEAYQAVQQAEQSNRCADLQWVEKAREAANHLKEDMK